VSGGWIICGMEEKGGIATNLCGLGTATNVEREILRLQQCADSSIEPRVPGLTIRAIDLNDPVKGMAIVLRIPRSYAAPHRVKETSKFHIRRSVGKNEMNVAELRAAFNLSETFESRIRNFRQRRIDALAEFEHHEEIPVFVHPGLRLVLHVVPITFTQPLFER
jgi:hypothetical protein